jgi:thioredoxin reductase
MYDLIVIGGGPAGITAAATAINQRLETLIIAERWGGQTTYAMQIEDMEGRETITGEALLDAFRRQLDYLDFARDFDTVTRITPDEKHFVVYTARGDCYEARALIMATGAKPQRLNVPGEGRLAGRGLSYSVATHASLFLGKDVAVIGNGRRAQWAAARLAQKAHRVYLLASEPLVPTPLANKLAQMERIEILDGATVQEVLGRDFVEGILVKTTDGETQEIPIKGVFVKLTLISEQVLVHIGEGAKAALSAYHYLLMQ